MFYEPKNGHGLPHNPLTAIVSPRPIAWVATRGADGAENLAPYSFFNAVAYSPPQIMFASTSRKPDRGDTKDSVANIRETGVFCVNIVEYAAREAMNLSSGPWPREEDEFAMAGLEREECRTVACSRIAGAPASLECRMRQIVTLEGKSNFMVIGEITGIHLRDDCLVDGRFDVTRYRPLARLGYRDYTVVETLFPMNRPDET